MCEDGIVGLETKALVWKWNCGTSSRSIFLVWKRNYETTKHYSSCRSGISYLKFTQHSESFGTVELKYEPQQKHHLGTVSNNLLGGLNRFYGIPTSPLASIMAQNIQLFGPREGFLTHHFRISSLSGLPKM